MAAIVPPSRQDFKARDSANQKSFVSARLKLHTPGTLEWSKNWLNPGNSGRTRVMECQSKLSAKRPTRPD